MHSIWKLTIGLQPAKREGRREGGRGATGDDGHSIHVSLDREAHLIGTTHHPRRRAVVGNDSQKRVAEQDSDASSASAPRVAPAAHRRPSARFRTSRLFSRGIAAPSRERGASERAGRRRGLVWRLLEPPHRPRPLSPLPSTSRLVRPLGRSAAPREDASSLRPGFQRLRLGT